MEVLERPEHRKIKCPHYKYESFKNAPNMEKFLNKTCDEEFEIEVKKEEGINSKNQRQKCPSCGRYIEISRNGEGISILNPSR